MNTTNPIDASIMMGKGEALVLDVRTPEEFAEGHLKGAWNFDINGEKFVEHIKGLEPNTPYIVYCQTGGRSSRATSLMHELGFGKAMNMMGGINAWKAAGLPVEK